MCVCVCVVLCDEEGRKEGGIEVGFMFDVSI